MLHPVPESSFMQPVNYQDKSLFHNLTESPISTVLAVDGVILCPSARDQDCDSDTLSQRHLPLFGRQ